MKKATALDRQKDDTDDIDRESGDAEGDPRVVAKIYGHINECRGELNKSEFISSATKASYESLFVEYIEQQNLEFARSSVQFARDTAARAKNEYDEMMADLERHDLSAGELVEMHAWFTDDGMLDMVRKQKWRAKADEFIRTHATIATRRNALEKRLSGLDENDAEGISVLRDGRSFLRLSVRQRTDLLDRLEALDIASATGRKHLFQEANSLLKEASAGKGRYMHAASTGALLKRMMASGNPEKFKEETLLPSLRTHRDTRSSFDGLQAELMAAEKAPIVTPKLDAFLRWDVDQRSSFIAEGHRRLRAQDEEKDSLEKELSLSKKLAEKYMRMQDWKGAEAFLEDARGQFPEDKDLAVMQAYLDNHRTDVHAEKEEEDMERISGEIDAMIAKVSPEMRTIYVAMAMQGPEAFRTFAESVERGTLLKRKEESRDTPAEEAPARPTASGIRMEEESEGKNDDDNEEVEEEEVVVAGETADAQKEAAEEVSKDGEEEKTLNFTRISAEMQDRHARNINRPILRMLEDLDERDGEYGKAA